MLQVLLEPNQSGKTNEMVISICRENAKMTKKLAKSLLKKFNQQVYTDKMTPYLRALKKFMLIDDSLKRYRMEWIFGVP